MAPRVKIDPHLTVESIRVLLQSASCKDLVGIKFWLESQCPMEVWSGNLGYKFEIWFDQKRNSYLASFFQTFGFIKEPNTTKIIMIITWQMSNVMNTWMVMTWWHTDTLTQWQWQKKYCHGYCHELSWMLPWAVTGHITPYKSLIMVSCGNKFFNTADQWLTQTNRPFWRRDVCPFHRKDTERGKRINVKVHFF